MRILKFRAWHKTDCRMIVDGWSGDVFTTPANILKFGDAVEIMQFTGLIDRDGREIYEGDIVMFPNDYPASIEPFEPPETNNDVAIVEWSDEGRWSLNADISTNRTRFADWIHEYKGELKVIGNIYESSSLMQDLI